ncbi:MAG: hypothetical protein J5972_05705, partial [Eubacterium sp.]|nr:hypothetical protein [Eubacterium sp.]
WKTNPEEEDFSYKEYPLFNVIYQNEELMKKYHEYMKDCAKVAAFGGTTSWGELVESGRVGKAVDALKEKLFDAASEKLGDNVTYLNNSIQPDDVKMAFDNLKRIVALRSAGVWNQVEGIDSLACGYGCNLATLGNAVEGDNTSTGVLTIADASTGIRLRADYSNHDKQSRPPSLTAEVVPVTSEVFQKLKSAAGVAEDSDIVVYSMSDTSEPAGNYKLYLPLEKTMLAEDVSAYCYTPEGVEYLGSKVNDRTIEVESDSIRYVAIAKGRPLASWVKWVGVAAGVILLVLLVVAILKKKRK